MNVILGIGLLADLNQSLTVFLARFGLEPDAFWRYCVRLLIIWGVAFAAYQLVKVAARRVIIAADDGDETTRTWQEKRASTVSGMFRRVGAVVILLITLILTLQGFMDTTAILAGAGVLGLAISFGSQSVIKDLIAGFFILVENQFDVGDVIEIANKAGSVERMTLRFTQLRDVEGVVHIVPNGQITTVSNKTRLWSCRILDIGVGYGAEVDKAIAVLRDEAKKFGEDKGWRRLLDKPPEVVGVQSLGESAVTIRVALRTIPGSQWVVGREFLRRVKNRLDQEAIEIPFPQRTVHLIHKGGRPPVVGEG